VRLANALARLKKADDISDMNKAEIITTLTIAILIPLRFFFESEIIPAEVIKTGVNKKEPGNESLYNPHILHSTRSE
jgi:hypothetical protein